MRSLGESTKFFVCALCVPIGQMHHNRTKSDLWALGLWCELLTLFIVTGIFVVVDAQRHQMPSGAVRAF